MKTFTSVEEILNIDDKKWIIVYFHASFCKPCKKVSPEFENLEKKYMNTICFGKADIEKTNLGQAFDITMMPVFIVFINENNQWMEYKRYIGTDLNPIVRLLDQIVSVKEEN